MLHPTPLLLSLLLLAGVTVGTPALTLDKRGITCLQVGATATATWTNSAGESCSYVGVVGSNYGENSDGEGDYSCNGRCGTGCTGFALGNVYTQHCFSHDMCSYFNDASGGASDPNCGAAFKAAEEDYLFGLVDGCSQTNPTNAVIKPTTSPVCSS
ncbi:hypothetical protein BO70DRAFT_390610 [Aspergillus heteromorphus CBS 117.55]|uniref:DUF8213 domain-containing protein n=1 Tax=Aspergillus heteromorphus CBS 117.55 TaxID=1448321 RepID=A0A317V1V4_9EURO|nr:uncharacterized protein BO70DRAFT_390610 [Aspergillus heteromorphus CBS 117.55]PWY66777.1 hypothetical protein BO70DRAFT_390610 [Aspergillus heteromorphus CBS 117.55]